MPKDMKIEIYPGGSYSDGYVDIQVSERCEEPFVFFASNLPHIDHARSFKPSNCKFHGFDEPIVYPSVIDPKQERLF